MNYLTYYSIYVIFPKHQKQKNDVEEILAIPGKALLKFISLKQFNHKCTVDSFNHELVLCIFYMPLQTYLVIVIYCISVINFHTRLCIERQFCFIWCVYEAWWILVPPYIDCDLSRCGYVRRVSKVIAVDIELNLRKNQVIIDKRTFLVN